jgi:general secretion pathway protein G
MKFDNYGHKKAFTMVELVFVIVIIGILSAIAIPKLAATRDDAVIAKARATIASVRSSLNTERQKRILRGNFTPVGDLGDSTYAFSYFDSNTSHPVVGYPIKNCVAEEDGCWERVDAANYKFHGPSGVDAVFTLSGNKLNCTSNCGDFD